MKPFEHNGRKFTYSTHYQGWLGHKPDTNVVCVAKYPNGYFCAVQAVRLPGFESRVGDIVVEGFGDTPQQAVESLEARVCHST